MIETEVKVKVENFILVRERLKFLGFNKVRLVHETDIYYNHPVRNFSQTHEILRIRKSITNTITYKGPVFSRQTKTRVEHNCDVDDPELMRKILHSLGFKQWKTIIKTREIWKSNDARVNLDYVDSLGRFVEVEIISTNHQNIAGIEERLFLMVKQLGLNISDITRKSYIKLINEMSLK